MALHAGPLPASAPTSHQTPETMKTNHAPGPWKYRDVVHGSNFNEIGPASASYWICRIPSNDANAKLIVAAPELLAALQGCLGVLNHGTPNPHTRHIDAARAAIAKATA